MATMIDPLSEVLRSVRLTGGIFLDARFTAPWCVRTNILAEDCGPFPIKPPLLIAYPQLTGVLFETPHMLEMAKPFLQVFGQFRLPARVELVAGDFLADIHVEADLYLLKGVLQQWDDAEALAACVRRAVHVHRPKRGSVASA